MGIPRAALAAAILALALTQAGAAGKSKTAAGNGKAPSKPAVAVSILPQVYFVDRISGGRVSAFSLVGPGQSPHSYEPTPRQMSALAAAEAWLSIGVDFEKGLKPKVAAIYPKLAIVETNAGVEYRNMEGHGHDGDAGADGDAHDESGPDPHVWLGRKAAKAMAASIRDALSRLDPAGASVFAANCDAFVRDIDAAFGSLKTELAPLRGKSVFVFHPSFGYFLDEYGIAQEAVETGGKEPTQKNLSVLIERAKADGAKAIFVQAQFPTTAATAVANAVGAVVETIDPLAPDWLENIKRIGTTLKRAAAK